MIPLIMLIIYKIECVFRLVSHDDISMRIAPKASCNLGVKREYYFTHYLISQMFILRRRNSSLVINKRLRMNYTLHVILQWRMLARWLWVMESQREIRAKQKRRSRAIGRGTTVVMAQRRQSENERQKVYHGEAL